MRLAVAARAQDVNRGTVEVYFDALCPQTTAEEWGCFTRDAVASGRFRFFPTVAEILEALREYRGERLPEAEAIEAYEHVLSAGTYTPNGGTSWNYRAVREACGDAAAEAFLASGGDLAFRANWDESKRRQRFVSAYAATARSASRTRLLGSTQSARALPASSRRGRTSAD
jgi:hypothetical protein